MQRTGTAWVWMRTAACVMLAAGALGAAGCQKEQQVKPDYDKPLPPGATALRLLLSPGDWPNVQPAFDSRSEDLQQALDRSIRWFKLPSTTQHFPLGDVTHIRAETSVYAMQQLLRESPDARTFEQRLIEEFNCYTTVGYDDRGGVLYTGYYTPVFRASKTRTADYQYPLYKRPADLRSDPVTGQVLGAYPTRRELEASGKLNGLELVYLPSRFDQYIIQVNGSAKLELVNGGQMFVGFTGTNGHEYTGLGATLKAEGKIERASIDNLRRYFDAHPGELEQYINRNDRYVFFGEYDGSNWPAGSIGVKVTPMRTLATDKAVFPRAGVVLAQTQLATASGGSEPFTQFMLDQDTGGAIRAAGRADIYVGIGPQAGQVAGGQYAEGRLYYFFLKHENVLKWRDRMKPGGDTTTTGAPPAPTGGGATIDPSKGPFPVR